MSETIVRRWLVVLLLIALGLRLAYSLMQDPNAPYANGNDSMWYLANGYTLVTDKQPATIVVQLRTLSIPPVYLLFTGVWQALLSPAAAVIALRVLQAVMSAAACYFAYRLARRLTGSPGAGLIAAGALAVSPAFIVESSVILTETVYMFLVAGALTAYVEFVARRDQPRPRTLALLALCAALLGLATLTRAVLLLFPLGLAAHLVMIDGWRVGLRRALWLLLVYSAVVSTWTIYSAARWHKFVIAGEGFAANLYIGATGWDGAEAVDERIEQQAPEITQTDPQSEARQNAYAGAAASVIRSDPLGYLKNRARELASAYLQPHGPVAFSGESLRSLISDWWGQDRSPAGLIAVTRGDAFWPKLLIYVFHFAALGFGLVGIVAYRRRWRLALPIIGFIIYTTLVHFVMLALPRYIFPTEIFWWVFAAAALQKGLKAVNALTPDWMGTTPVKTVPIQSLSPSGRGEQDQAEGEPVA